MTRFPLFLTAVLTSIALGAAVPCSAAAQAAPVGAVEHFPTGCGVQKLISGPDGDVWFNCYRFTYHRGLVRRAVIGRMTPQGVVTEFTAGIPAGAAIRDLVAGPDGNVWFTLEADVGADGRFRSLAAIGRITPEGVVTTFSAGLRKRSYPGEIIAGPDGNLWFLDGVLVATPLRPDIGRVTPQGAITEFPTKLPQALRVGGLAAGPDGNVWFTHEFDLPNGENEPGGLIGRIDPSGAVESFGAQPSSGGTPVAGPEGNVWFIDDVGKAAIDRVTSSGEITRFGAGLVGGPSHLVLGPDGNIWFTAQQSVGRVTPSGQVSRFTDCMDFRRDFSEATQIVSGPGGDLWFSTITSRMTPSMSEPPTIGRVTPAGEITLFKDGVENQSSLIAGPDGKVWFAGDGEEIDRITPPSAPVNTFVFAPGKAKAAGAAEVPVEVPGPGRIELHQLALVLPGKKTKGLQGSVSRAVASTCGPTRLKFRLAASAVAALRREGRVKVKVSATFTPTGGSANTEIRTVAIGR
jgi:streptogramin lyase